MSHPGLKMSKQREKLWLEEATLEDFVEQVELLNRLYAKKVHKPGGIYRPDALAEDTPEYYKEKSKAIAQELEHAW